MNNSFSGSKKSLNPSSSLFSLDVPLVVHLVQIFPHLPHIFELLICPVHIIQIFQLVISPKVQSFQLVTSLPTLVPVIQIFQLVTSPVLLIF